VASSSPDRTEGAFSIVPDFARPVPEVPARPWRLGPEALAVVGVAGVGAVVGAFSLAVERTSYDTWAGVVVATVLVLVSIPLVLAARRLEDDHTTAALLPWALAAKLLGVIPRYAVAFALYDGNADASSYHDAGVALAKVIRGGNLFPHIDAAPGTSFIQWLTGLTYAVTGPTKLGGFFVFSWLGFWGLWLFYRAFVIACPEGDRRRYALIVFFLPSLLFWPSSIGKEAWMAFALGLAAWGTARVLQHRRGGLIALGGGLVALGQVRPHVAAIVAVAALLALLLRRPPAGAHVTAPLSKIGAILVAGVGVIVVLNATEAFFGLDKFNAEAVRSTRERAGEQTDEGGSAFEHTGNTAFSPSQFPVATMNVLFKPFPWEANNAQALIASIEGGLTFALFVFSFRRVLGSVRSILHTPYVLFCMVYVVVFIYGFSSFSNYGVLTRQRVQVFPFVLVLVCLPPLARRSAGGWRDILEAPGPAAPVPAAR
jgi:hypothetical protein